MNDPEIIFLMRDIEAASRAPGSSEKERRTWQLILSLLQQKVPQPRSSRAMAWANLEAVKKYVAALEQEEDLSEREAMKLEALKAARDCWNVECYGTKYKGSIRELWASQLLDEEKAKARASRKTNLPKRIPRT